MKVISSFSYYACLFFINFANSSTIIIGDSHTRAFTGISNIRIEHLGPVTMHRIGRDGINLKNLGVESGDTVVFVFGEIDVRCHIGKQRDHYNRDLDEIVQTLAFNYIKAILENISFFKTLQCIVYNIPPPTDIAYNPDFPFYRSLTERVMITKYLNKTLRHLCEISNLAFLDIYDDFTNENGELRSDLSDKNVHINWQYNQPIQKKLQALLNQINSATKPSLQSI